MSTSPGLLIAWCWSKLLQRPLPPPRRRWCRRPRRIDPNHLFEKGDGWSAANAASPSCKVCSKAIHEHPLAKGFVCGNCGSTAGRGRIAPEGIVKMRCEECYGETEVKS